MPRRLQVLLVNTRACRESSLISGGAALAGVRARSLRSVRSLESSEAFQSMNRGNNCLVLRNFYLSFGSVM